MMDMHTRNQYLKEVRLEYLKAPKKQKTRLLDEAVKRTRLDRKGLIKKLKPKSNLDRVEIIRRSRTATYGHETVAALARCFEIFDYPCGQRLAPLLPIEVDRLRRLKELSCTDTVAAKLARISPSTVDRALRHTKEVERMKRKYHKKIHPLLYQKVPVKVFLEQDRGSLGNIQIDGVEHCGSLASGEFIYTLSTTDIATGWWEGEPVMGRGQERVREAISKARARYPVRWKEVHSDNGGEFINWHLYRYCEREHLDFTRSRPYKKNDNCLVEQKNWTHVKKFVGYLRYDTEPELQILDDLYRKELRLFKNFFQPVIKLTSKERVGGKIHKKYDVPRTPYARVMESKEVSEQVKQELKRRYESLNPALLKREIDRTLNLLYKAYQAKQTSAQKVEPKIKSFKKLMPATVSFLMTQPRGATVSS